MNEQKIGSRWSNDEKDNHINCLEILAVYYALKSFKDDLNTVENVKILTDNTTAVSYINSMGGIKSIECNRIARKIWIWCIEHQIWLIATHIPGKLNTKADYQSRNFNDQIKWQLNKNNFEKVCLLWNKPEIDLFASHLNTKLPIFCSWKADPESSFVDAFTLDWGNFSYSYMFPPFSMIGRCVKKIIKDKAYVLFVGPLWPTQPWFVQVMKLLKNNPYVIKANKKLLTLPYKDIVHPLEKTLMSDIRNRLQNRGISEKTSTIIMASWRSGTQKQYKTYIKKWFIFCLERKEDKFHTSVELVLEFLTYLFECGLSYSALNNARSALSVFGLTFDNVPVGKHPLVIRFLKGVYHLRPTVRNNVNIWDVSIVLRLLRRLSPVADVSVKDLTLKLVMLIALTNATRSQSIHLLKLSNMQKQKDCFRFKIFDLLKQSRPGYKNPEVILKSFPPDRRLCMYLILKEYLKRTVDQKKIH